MERGELEPNAGRVVIDALKWVASKLKPREYGDRAQLDVAASLDVTTRVIDHAPEWMQSALEDKSGSIRKGPERIPPTKRLDNSEGDDRTDPVCA